jgi:hypothetical protein
MSLINPNTWHLICNNFNLNFIFGTVYLCVCVCAFSLHRESPDMILGDKPLISEVVLSQCLIRALSNHINVYPALYVHTRSNHLTRFFSRSDFYLPDHTWPPFPASIPDPFPIRLLTTRSYPATLPDFLT